jgi:hypothetical protein
MSQRSKRPLPPAKEMPIIPVNKFEDKNIILVS